MELLVSLIQVHLLYNGSYMLLLFFGTSKIFLFFIKRLYMQFFQRIL